MGILTGKHLPRRTFLRGIGATVALPFLEAMVPARKAFGATTLTGADRTRLVCIEMVHGAAGSTKWGSTQHLWSPAAEGRDFDLGPTALSSLEPFQKDLTIVSDTDLRNAEAFIPEEIGGDHFRSSAVFLTQSHPRQTESSDVLSGTSMDQLYAQRFGQDTPIPSMQLCIENVDQAGGCAYGYSCVYTDTISWKSPTEPLPMIRDPRLAFRHGLRRGRHGGRARRPTTLEPEHFGFRDGRSLRAEGHARRSRPPSGGSLSREHPRDRATHPESRRAQYERRDARATASAGGGSRLLRRAREAHVRPPSARPPGGHDARVLVQDGPGRLESRLPRERCGQRIPSRVPPRGQREEHHGFFPHQPLPREPAPVLSREAREH